MIKGKLSEKQIENMVLSWFKMRRVFAFKVKSMGTFDPTTKRFRAPSAWYRKGCPDVLVCWKGKFLGFEVKTPIGRLSLHQKLFHDDVKQAGGKVFVVRDVKELDAIFFQLEMSA